MPPKEVVNLEELDAALREHLLPEEVTYRTTHEGKVDGGQVLKYKPLLRALRETCNEFLNQKTLGSAIYRIALEKENEWKLVKEKSAFSTETGQALRAAMRDISQSISKASGKKKPPWLQTFLDEGADGEAAVAPAAAAPAAAPAAPAAEGQSVRMDFDPILQMAYKECNGKRVEMVRPTALEGAADEDECVAEWKDGSRWNIPVLLVGELNGKLATPKAQTRKEAGFKTSKGIQSAFIHWEGAHKNGGRVVVRPSSNKIIISIGRSLGIIWRISRSRNRCSCL